jgi:hypothetical protein
MSILRSLLSAIDEYSIAREVSNPHEEARMKFRLHKNVVADFEEFTEVIAKYYQHHYALCVARGGVLSRSDAAGAAKELIERAYRRRQGNLISAFKDGVSGTHGGMRVVIEAISDGIREQAIDRYVRDVFDRHVAPHSFEERVAIMREFMESSGVALPRDMRGQPPERYAHEFQEILRAHVAAVAQVGSVARRL